MDKIAILGSFLAPRFNECTTKKIKVLSDRLNIDVFTSNNIGYKILRRMNNYHIINDRLLALKYLYFKKISLDYEKIILAWGLKSPMLEHMNSSKAILFLVHEDFIESECEKMKLLGIRGAIVESEEVMERLMECGVGKEKILCIKPIMDTGSIFKGKTHLPLDPFRLLSASSPYRGSYGRFDSKGIPLLLEAFKMLTYRMRARLTILWRGEDITRLEKMIEELELDDYVDIVNKDVNMVNYYGSHHVTVLSYIKKEDAPPLPLSAAESIMSGRPVVTTYIGHLGRLVNKTGCGLSCASEPKELSMAIEKCHDNYHYYVERCKSATKEFFDESEEKYLSIKEFLINI